MAQSGSLLVTGGHVVGHDGTLERSDVAVEHGLITYVGDASSIAAPDGADRIDADGLIVAPGLIDIQINGGFGHDFTAEAKSIWDVGARLPRYGVTLFLPTVVSSGAEARDKMMSALAAGPPTGYRGAVPLGAHFEGPFISPDAAGAHDPTLLRLPTNADPDVDEWSPASGVRMVTVAPELEGALDLVRSLVGRGVVVSAGHSTADRAQAIVGFDAGITYATHVFNAMPPMNHREPGLAGTALVDTRVTVGLIADAIHVHRDVVKIAATVAGTDRVSLVTDATAALGMAPGVYRLGGREVVLDGTSVRLAKDGRLAGSALAADEALRRFMTMSTWSPANTLAAMTSVPARMLGLKDRGELRVGQRADLTLFTIDLQLVATYIAGERWA